MKHYIMSVGFAAAVAAGAIQPIPLMPVANNSNQSRDSGYPTGDLILGNVLFHIDNAPLNCWSADAATGNNPRIMTLPVNVFGVREVHTLINTIWGQPGPSSYARVEFTGSSGAFYAVDLVGNVNIRDYNTYTWTNSINNTSTINVFNVGIHRIDKQRFDLPAAFQNQTLTTIRFIDNGGSNFQRIVVQGVSVDAEASAADTYFTPVEFNSAFNDRIQNRDGAFPSGSIILDATPYWIPPSGNNCWYAEFAAGANPRVLSVPVNIAGVTEVRALLNTSWGGAGNYARVEFVGASSGVYTVNLTANSDIRDWNQNTFSNNINGTTSHVAWTNGSHRIDAQHFVLPPSFANDTLTTIRFVDTGATNVQRLYVQGITVLTPPPPPTQWTSDTGGNGHSYEQVQRIYGATWQEAADDAAARGGTLASVESAEENAFVSSLVLPNDAFWFIDSAGNGAGPWLGGLQLPGSSEPSGGWVWSDSQQPFDYTNWAPQEPNNSGGEDRLQLFGRQTLKGSLWNDRAAAARMRGYIVEYSRCVADYNSDGGIDGSDVDAFFIDWEAGLPGADVNQDGGVDGADVDAFFTAWESGSC